MSDELKAAKDAIALIDEALADKLTPPNTPLVLKAARAALADRIEASLQAAGEFVLVPREITPEMHAAAVRTIIRCHGNADFPPRVWRAMLAAAPNPPAGPGEGKPCTCPSGDGSLRWPCPTHPPEPFGHYFRDMAGNQHFHTGCNPPSFAQTEIVPLYASPPPAQLSEDEREALTSFENWNPPDAGVQYDNAKTLCAALRRLSGETQP